MLRSSLPKYELLQRLLHANRQGPAAGTTQISTRGRFDAVINVGLLMHREIQAADTVYQARHARYTLCQSARQA